MYLPFIFYLIDPEAKSQYKKNHNVEIVKMREIAFVRTKKLFHSFVLI